MEDDDDYTCSSTIQYLAQYNEEFHRTSVTVDNPWFATIV